MRNRKIYCIYRSFYGTNLDMVSDAEAMNQENLRNSLLMLECKDEHLDSFRVVNLVFRYLLFSYRTRYYGLPYALQYMLS